MYTEAKFMMKTTRIMIKMQPVTTFYLSSFTERSIERNAGAKLMERRTKKALQLSMRDCSDA